MPSAFIIEDDLHIANILSLALQAVDCETEVVFDGQVALNRLAEITPDIIVLDLCLPSVSGQAILAYIRAEERFANTRIIIATGDVIGGETLKTKADHVFIKPFSLAKLREAAQVWPH